MNYTLIVDGMKDLTEGLKSCTWPEKFVSGLLGMSPATAEKLRAYLFYYMILYAVSAVISLVLHYKKEMKSFSNFGRKMMDFICTVLMVMCCWLVPQFVAQSKLMASQVEGEFSFTEEGFYWLSDYLQAGFDPIWLSALMIFIAIMPLLTARRYLKEYKLLGIPWAIYDVGFGVFAISTAAMAMAHGSFLWYLAIPAAMVLVHFGQTGGTDLE